MAEKRESNIVLKDLRTGKTYKRFTPTTKGFFGFKDEEVVVDSKGFPSYQSEEFIPEDSYELVVAKNVSALSVTLDLDCSDALKGLKAVTRSAKKALAALRDLEEQQRKVAKSSEVVINIDGQSIARSVNGINDDFPGLGTVKGTRV